MAINNFPVRLVPVNGAASVIGQNESSIALISRGKSTPGCHARPFAHHLGGHGNVISLRPAFSYGERMKNTYSLTRALAFGLAMLAGGFALPQTAISGSDLSQYDPENIAQIDILPGWRQADGSHMAALRIQLAPGWKTYWRAPGDAGIPPSFDWDGSRNLQAVAFHWPVPTIFDTAGLRTVGYLDELILPIQLYPSQTGQDITLKGRISLGVCSDVCMPMEASFNANLAMGDAAPGSDLIRRALRQRPKTSAEAGLRSVSCDVEPISDGLRVTARMALPKVGANEVAVIEGPDQSIWVSETQVSREGGTLVAVSDLVPPAGKPFALSRSDIRITVLAGGRGVDIANCVGG